MIYQAGATRNYPDKDESRDASLAPALFFNNLCYLKSNCLCSIFISVDWSDED